MLNETRPGVHPRLKLDKDTIQRGDSLTGIIGVVFNRPISEERRKDIIATLSYLINTTETKATKLDVFFKSRRLNDTTFRFGLLPKHEDIGLGTKSFKASINVQYYSSDHLPQDHTFQQTFEYYVKE